jgi:hypothetical protein
MFSPSISRFFITHEKTHNPSPLRAVGTFYQAPTTGVSKPSPLMLHSPSIWHNHNSIPPRFCQAKFHHIVKESALLPLQEAGCRKQ